MLHRKLVQSYSNWTPYFQKFLSTVENVNILEETEIKKKLPKRTIRPEGIRDILRNDNLDHYVDILPSALLRRHSNICAGLHLVNSDAAKLFSSMISEELLKSKSFVVECNPGFGFLTKELLESGIYPINLYEKCDKFLEPNSPLSNLMHTHKNKLRIKHLNISYFWKTLMHDKFFNEKLTDTYFENVPRHDWKDKTYIQIIAATENRTTFALILHNFFNQTSLFDYGRPSFYLVIPSYIWERFTKDHTNPVDYRFYSQHNVMLYLFFDYKCLGELTRENFIPWPYGRNKHKDVPMTVVRLEPKVNVYDIISKDDLRPFWFFLKYCLKSKSNQVIKEFEKLVPGCGPKLIQDNIHVFTKFKELDPNQLLKLFLDFKSWPEYVEGSFMHNKEIKKEEEEEFEHDVPEIDSQNILSEAITKESKD